MHWIAITIGLIVILAGMQDLFHTLFHPTQQGNISEYMTLYIWRGFRRFAPGQRLMVGPLNFLMVIVFWGLSVIIGFALIYRPFMLRAFIGAPGMDVSKVGSFFSAVNLSLSSLITVPMGLQTDWKWLQLAMATEAVLGFAILTASISWLLSIYPVIEHRRSLAHEVSLLHFSESSGLQRFEELDDSTLQTLLFGLATQLNTVRTELSQFPISYYFQETDDKTALGPALYLLAEVARDVSSSNRRARMAAATLGGSIDDLLQVIEEKYLPKKHESRWDTLRELLADHGRSPLTRPKPSKVA
jgi:hypothetical protein